MRKILTFLALVSVSAVVLHLTIGFENFTDAVVREGDQPLTRPEEDKKSTPLMQTDKKGREQEVNISVSGKLTLPMRVERVVLEGGYELLIPLYTLHAEDSEPVEDDLFRLEGVRVVFQEAGVDENGVPTAVDVGELVASTAFVQLGRDANGAPSAIKEDKDIDLRDVEFTTQPGARIKNMHLTVDRILVRSSEESTRLRTPTADQRFELTIRDKDEIVMTGRGLDATIPSDRVDPATRQMQINVLSEPVLQRADLSLKASGELAYRESMASGVAKISLAEDVEIRGLAGSDLGDMVAKGDQLDAVLVRRGSGQSSGAVWQSIRLGGENVALSSQDLALRCRQMDVSPGVGGDPYLITADGLGSPVTLEQGGANSLAFSASGRIHLCRVHQYFDPIYRGFGIPAGSTSSWASQLIIFEGDSVVEDEGSGLFISASDGMQLLRSDVSTGPSLAMGLGKVAVTNTDLQMSGNAGFTLWQQPLEQKLRLGPAIASANHAFSLDSADGLSFSGHGLCQVLQAADGHAAMTLESPLEDLVLEQESARLEGVRRLEAELFEGKPTSLFATGTECHLERKTSDPAESIEGFASSISSSDGRNFALLGSPARLNRELDGSKLEAPTIDIYQIAEGEVMVLAEGPEDSQAKVYLIQEAAESGANASRIQLEANSIRLLPRLVPTDVRRLASLHLGAPGMSVDQPHVLASNKVSVTQEAEDGSLLARAYGDAFLMRISERAGLLTGAPAIIQRNQEDGKQVTARARKVRFESALDGDPVMVLRPTPGYPPVLEVSGLSGDEFGDFENIRVTCQGDIYAHPDKVDFLGAVEVEQLDAEGNVDPSMSLTADRMEMLSDGRQLREIVAYGDAEFSFNQVQASGDRLIIDVVETSCLAIGDGRNVHIVYPGSLFRARMLEINYRSMDLKSWLGNHEIGPVIRSR